jgi:UDP-glucose 4-epimerase
VRILVTGGAGYIGSVTVERLIEQGHQAIVLDNLSQGHRAAVHGDALFVEGDLADRTAIDALLAEHHPDAVMHFASRTLVGESMEKPFLYLGENIRNGLNLLESMIAHGVLRFILSSTANLFDDPETIPITEDERLVPGSPYGESKFILERMLHWLDRTHGLRFAALRYFNAAGATASRGEDHDPETHLIPLVLQVALGQRDKVTIFGNDYPTRDGTCVRDYIHVADLAKAHILAMQALDEGSRVYNLGNGTGFTVSEVVSAARQITGHAIPVEAGARRPGDPAELVAGSDRIRRELGWQPQYPGVKEIIQSAWHWHEKNPNGYL